MFRNPEMPVTRSNTNITLAGRSSSSSSQISRFIQCNKRAPHICSPKHINFSVSPVSASPAYHNSASLNSSFLLSGWEPRTTWLWAPYDYSKGAKEEDQEWGREQENEDILDKLLEYSKRDFGFPVKADSDEKIPVPADVDISTEGTF